MKKTKKIIITVISVILIIAVGLFIYFKFFYDDNKLNLIEKEWINKNKSSLVTVNIPNALNIFASDGKGVFYDFLDEFTKDTDIQINKNITSLSGGSGLGFIITKDYINEGLLLYTDHYIVISKNDNVITDYNDLKGNTVGGLSDAVARLNSSYQSGITYMTFESREDMLKSFDESKVNYLVIPRNEYIDVILQKGYKIVYHLDDLNINYYINYGNDKTLNSIVKKFYNGWMIDHFESSYYDNCYNLFVEKLSLSQIETDSLTNKLYTYGFINETPYNLLNSSKYGGIVMSYLDEFSKFSKVDFTYKKFKSNTELVKSFNNKKIDLIFNNNNLGASNITINTNLNNNIYIIAPLSNNMLIKDINSIGNETIYVLKSSLEETYLKNYKNINIKTVSNEKSLFKKSKKDYLIAIDANTYNYYVNNKIKNYHIIYSNNIKDNFSFKYVNNSDPFYKLFSSYVNYLSPYQETNEGFTTYKIAEQSGNTVSSVAKYVLVVIGVGIVVVGLVISSKKHIKLNTKIKKDEKLKFVDMLTSLKNRNYLNERINAWNQNTIYPQAIIVIDLNNIKYLNDTFGHEEGDKQIMAAANILHQTQLDNTEVMRTDGNEFMVYLVGYTEKQVVNYLKKLVKEFNDLPYEYGAAFGFSMIVDDLKLIDDAINEATIQMRENKEIEAKDEEK